MKAHPGEFAMACEYSSLHEFEHLNPEQIHQVMVRGRELQKWFRAHLRLHAAISLSAIGSIFAIDWFAWIALARCLVAGVPGKWALILAAIFTGAVHSWLMYSLSIYSLHEGAAHNLIFPGKGPLSRAASFLSTNMCRLAAAEPEYYSECHMAHHAKFGTVDDPEFVNFVFPAASGSTSFPSAASSTTPISSCIAHPLTPAPAPHPAFLPPSITASISSCSTGASACCLQSS